MQCNFGLGNNQMHCNPEHSQYLQNDYAGLKCINSVSTTILQKKHVGNAMLNATETSLLKIVVKII